MTLSRDEILSLAKQHDAAERERRPIRPHSQFAPGLTLEDGYAVQQAWTELKLARGQRITGRKIGLTSRAMQSAMRINEPDFGTLFDNQYIPNGARLKAADFCDPRIEVELAFILKKDLAGPDLSVADVLAATDRIVPALELIAARSHRIDPQSGYARTLFDTVSDNAAGAGYVLGECSIPLDADLPWVGAVLSCNDTIEETGLAAGILGHPAQGIIWLARRFAAQGICLQAGQVFLAGSFTRPVVVKAGDTFVADYGPYGRITLHFD